MKVSVVIVGFNSSKFLQECIGSLNKQTYEDFEIIYVDNNSSDCSLEILGKFPKIKIIRSRENLGFAKGNNLGIRQSEGEYIVLLNPDTVVNKDWLKSLVDSADKNVKGGIFQSVILFYRNNGC